MLKELSERCVEEFPDKWPGCDPTALDISRLGAGERRILVELRLMSVDEVSDDTCTVAPSGHVTYHLSDVAIDFVRSRVART